MNFIKKNIVLFSVLIIALIMSAVFIYLAIAETGKMNEAVEKVVELKSKIRELNKQTPIPDKENAEKITTDADILAQKTIELQQVFGKPYIKAVEVMLKELGITNEEFMSLWKKVYDEESRKGSLRELIFNRFLAKLCSTKEIIKAKEIKAIDAFSKQVLLESRNVEPLDKMNINGCIMEAIGLPRKMDPILCKTYMSNMQEALISYMVGEDEKEPEFIFGAKGSVDSPVRKLTFDFESGSLPRPDEVPYIFKHAKLIEDLLFRLKDSGIETLGAISKKSLQGESKFDYLVFNYTVQVTGHVSAVRKFINSLNAAYKNNRIYVIKTLNITSEENAKAIVHGNVGSGENESNEEILESGRPILGINDTVTAELNFDYIIYIGDELPENY